MEMDEVKPEEVKSKAPTVLAENDGTLVGKSLEDQYRIARAFHASGLMPKALSTPEKVLVAMQYCRELGLPPMTSMNKIMVINGSPSLFGELPLGLVHRSGLLQSIREEWIYGEDGKLLGATCSVLRKGHNKPVVRSFTLDEAENAGLFRNDIWKKYTKRMLQMRARGWALKDAFPDVLNGAAIMEYDIDDLKDVGETNPVRSLADEINEETETRKE